MKKIMSILVVVLFTAIVVQAQEFKIAKSTGRLDIKDVNDVVIEGTTGNEIIFMSRDLKREQDKRAQGLKAISGSGLEDNTGFGLSVVDKGDVIEVRQLKRMDGPDVKILVPKGVSISLSHSSPHGSDVEFRNVEGEIEVTTVHNDVRLMNTTGPLTINTVHGDIEARLGANMKSPISLVSVHGHVDLAIPSNTKATMRISTGYGEIFADPEFKIQTDNKEGMQQWGSRISGKINGGGLDITLTTSHSNIYLRKN
jgi:hypothetical protein